MDCDYETKNMVEHHGFTSVAYGLLNYVIEKMQGEYRGKKRLYERLKNLKHDIEQVLYDYGGEE